MWDGEYECIVMWHVSTDEYSSTTMQISKPHRQNSTQS